MRISRMGLGRGIVLVRDEIVKPDPFLAPKRARVVGIVGIVVERAAVGRADSERGLLGFFRAPVHGRANISFLSHLRSRRRRRRTCSPDRPDPRSP